MTTFVDIGARLKQERERLGKSQTDFGVAAGVGRQSQFNYESGARVPDANYLAAIAKLGADVLFIVVGEESFEHVKAPTAEEAQLLALYRASSPDVRRAALGALANAAPPSLVSQVFKADVGSVVQGDLSVSGGMTISQRSQKRKTSAKADTK